MRFREAVAVVMLVFAIVISLVALWLPPAGKIDASVLWLVAQALLFAASTIGVKSFTINK